MSSHSAVIAEFYGHDRHDYKAGAQRLKALLEANGVGDKFDAFRDYGVDFDYDVLDMDDEDFRQVGISAEKSAQLQTAMSFTCTVCKASNLPEFKFCSTCGIIQTQ